MNSLSDYVLSVLIHQCATVPMLSSVLQRRSQRLRTHTTVKSVEKWLDKYTNLQHLTVNLGTSTRAAEQLPVVVRELRTETCERLRTIRIIDSVNSQNLHTLDTILPIMERCKNLELLQANVYFGLRALEKLASLPTFPVLVANPIRLDSSHWSDGCYETVDRLCEHLPDCIKVCLGWRYNSNMEEALKIVLKRRCVRGVTLHLSMDVEIESNYVEELELSSRSIRSANVITPSLTSLTLGPYINISLTAPRLTSLVLEGEVGSSELSLINSLPSLTSLHLTEWQESLPDLKCPSLTHLGVAAKCINASLLPPTLKSLIVLSECSCTGLSNTSLEKIDVPSTICEPLPATVTDLDVGEVDPVYLLNCKHLKRLSCLVVDSYTTSWPESITTLEVTGIVEGASLNSLPRALRSLHVNSDSLPSHWNLSQLRSLSGLHHLTEEQNKTFRGKRSSYD